MAQLIKKKFIGDKQVDGSKILLEDVKSVKVVDSSLQEIDLISLDGSDRVVLTNNVIASGDVSVTGNLTVNGTTTTINSVTLEVQDANILVNKNGTAISAEGAGLTVEADALELAKIAYDSTLASKFKVGLAGSELEVVTVSHTQSLSNKTIDADVNTISNIEVDNLKSGVLNSDAALTGAADTQVPSALAVKSYVDNGISALDQVYHKLGGQIYGAPTSLGSQDDFELAIIRNNLTRMNFVGNSINMLNIDDLNVQAATLVNLDSPEVRMQRNLSFSSAGSTTPISIYGFDVFDAASQIAGGDLDPKSADIILRSGSVTDVSLTTEAIDSGTLNIVTGNVSTGAGDSGSINIQTGTSVAGARGDVALDGNIIYLFATSHITAQSKNIRDVLDPQNLQDAATKNYVDVADGLLQSNINDVAADVADLVTLSGVAANSVNLGAFTGSTLSDTETVKSALQSLETALELDEQALADHINATTGAHAASAISVSPAVNGQSNVQLALEDHESRLDVLESATAPVFFKEKFVIATSVAPSTITLTHTPIANSIVAFVDRLAIHEGVGEDYTVSGNVITILNPGNGNGQIGTGDTVYVTYQYIP